MQGAPNLTDFSISTSSIDPLCGVANLGIAGSRLAFRITEEMAHEVCTELKRFLTQACRQEVGSKARR